MLNDDPGALGVVLHARLVLLVASSGDPVDAEQSAELVLSESDALRPHAPVEAVGVASWSEVGIVEGKTSVFFEPVVTFGREGAGDSGSAEQVAEGTAGSRGSPADAHLESVGV